MLIPRNYRRFLRKIGHPHWFWDKVTDWAFGERYRFRDRSVAYMGDGNIITIRRGSKVLWREDPTPGCVSCGAVIPEGRQVCPKCERGTGDGK